VRERGIAKSLFQNLDPIQGLRLLHHRLREKGTRRVEWWELRHGRLWLLLRSGWKRLFSAFCRRAAEEKQRGCHKENEDSFGTYASVTLLSSLLFPFASLRQKAESALRFWTRTLLFFSSLFFSHVSLLNKLYDRSARYRHRQYQLRHLL